MNEKVTKQQERSQQYSDLLARNALLVIEINQAEVLSSRTAHHEAFSSKTQLQRIRIRRLNTWLRSSINNQHVCLWPTKTTPFKHRVRVLHHRLSSRNSIKTMYHKRLPHLLVPHQTPSLFSSHRTERCRLVWWLMSTSLSIIINKHNKSKVSNKINLRPKSTCYTQVDYCSSHTQIHTCLLM